MSECRFVPFEWNDFIQISVRESSVASTVGFGEINLVHFLRLAALLLSLLPFFSVMAGGDGRMVLDIFPERIEATLLLPEAALEKALGSPMGAGEVRNEMRDVLAVYLQSHFVISSIEKQPMAFELDQVKRSSGDFVEATLLVYPPDEVTPMSFMVSGDLLQEPGASRTLDVFLQRDAMELRFGMEPLIPLGKLDYFHKSLTVERESLTGIARGSAAFATLSRLLLTSWPTLWLIAFLLLRATLASDRITSVAFVLSARSMMVFATGVGVALLAGTRVGAVWMAVSMALLLILLAYPFWRPADWRKELGLALAAGCITGALWNGMAIARGISGVDRMTLLLLVGAGYFMCAALTLLVLPTFLLVARRVSSVWLGRAGAICGIIVALQVLTTFGLAQ